MCLSFTTCGCGHHYEVSLNKNDVWHRWCITWSCSIISVYLSRCLCIITLRGLCYHHGSWGKGDQCLNVAVLKSKFCSSSRQSEELIQFRRLSLLLRSDGILVLHQFSSSFQKTGLEVRKAICACNANARLLVWQFDSTFLPSAYGIRVSLHVFHV